jgi:hypothetical protein
MRKSIHKDNSIARMKTKGERVYQMNIQLFPVTNASDLAAQSPVLESALDLKPETEMIEGVDEVVVVNVAPSVVVPEPVLQAQATAPVDPAAKDSRTNVSSLAATAASAADLFR